MAQQTHDAWVDIREIQHKHAFFYQIALGLVLVIVGIVIGAALFSSDESYGSNVYLNVISVFATVVVLNWLAERREERSLKRRIVMDVASHSNKTAHRALRELSKRHTLLGNDGALQGADLNWANLHDAYLEGVNLQQASLMDANLQQAMLNKANLQNANLLRANLERAELNAANLERVDFMGANLQQAYFWEANLQFANLELANLKWASLSRANLQDVSFSYADLQWSQLQFTKLQGANLSNANLRRAYLEDAEFDEKTTLPDDSKWTPDTDMRRFTDPQHPQFWRSDNPDSPAYGGDESTSA
jgi:uncharacterized protein YjbI with pentapeptide repeats